MEAIKVKIKDKKEYNISLGSSILTELTEHIKKSHKNKKIVVITDDNIKKLKKSSEKPIGEWNVYDIICKDDWVVVFVNSVLQNVATKTSVTSGKICLQSEGTAIEFRNIYIEPVDIK